MNNQTWALIGVVLIALLELFYIQLLRKQRENQDILLEQHEVQSYQLGLAIKQMFREKRALEEKVEYYRNAYNESEKVRKKQVEEKRNGKSSD